MLKWRQVLTGIAIIALYSCNETGVSNVEDSSSSSISSSSVLSSSSSSSSEISSESSSSSLEGWSSSVEFSSSSSSIITVSSSSSSPISSSSLVLSSSSNVEDLVQVQTGTYQWADMPAVATYMVNKSNDWVDSLDLTLYFSGTPKEIDRCNLMVSIDICQLYDVSGFNMPCTDLTALNVQIRKALPQALEVADSLTHVIQWKLQIPIIGMVLPSGTKVRMDFMLQKGMDVSFGTGDPRCEQLMQAPIKKFGSSDWSWMPHTTPVVYGGLPSITKDDLILAQTPVNPYIVLTRNGIVISGNAPK